MAMSVIRLGASLALACLFAGGATAAERNRVATVLPPKRPAALGGAAADIAATGSIVLAQAASPAASPGGDRTPQALIQRASAALNAVTSLTADFKQVGGDGRQLAGVMYLQRPGKLRFEYDKPSTMEIVSDGSTVLVRDRKLNTSDPYPIGQTPLKFLLSAKIDLARETSVTDVASGPDGVRISLEDSSTLGGTSRITLTFDPDVQSLLRWRVIDPQGYATTVSLSDVEKNRTIDPRIFMLNYMRPVE